MRGKRTSRTGDPVASVGGSGLIVVLWVVGILSLMVAAFAFDAHIEARLTSYYRKRKKAEYLALSGLEVAKLLMTKSAGMKGSSVDEEDEDDPWFESARRLKQGLGIRGLEETLGDGTIRLDIVPEPARRNINNLDMKKNKSESDLESNLERILEVGGIAEELWPDYVDPFIDWIDTDDESRDEPAETEDYYSALDSPYKAKNGPLDTVGELLLVKNFDRTVLFGGVIDTGFEGEEPIRVSGIADLLTVYGDGRVNVNAASQRVLMTLPGVDELVAGAIIEEREGWLDEAGETEDTHFKDVSDLFSRIPELSRAASEKYITTDSATYRITSVGSVRDVKRKVWCIAEYASGDLTILKWREED